MQWRRVAFAFMLILALVPALSVMQPNVSGQGYVTITTQTTTTGLYTYAATTRYETENTTSYFNQNYNFALDICGLGAQDNVGFRAIQGQRIRVEWKTANNLPVSIYILPFSSQKYSCDTFPESSALSRGTGGTGSLDWIASSAGAFSVWMWNWGAVPITGTLSIEAVGTTTFPSISYVTLPTTELLAFTQVTTIVSQVGLPFGNLGLLVAGAAVTVIAIIVVGGLFYRRSKRRDKSVTRIYDQAVTIPVSKIDEDTTAREATRAYAPADTDKIHEPNPPTELEVEEALSVTYCHECGAENMKDSKFCRKCAAKIDSPSK